jgi:phage terminase large subunit GpA-like protein
VDAAVWESAFCELMQMPPGTADAGPLIRGLADHLRPPEKIDPVTWGVRHRKLSSKESAAPGEWDPDQTPWARQILFDLSEESPATIVVAPKGAQLGFTEIGLIWSGWSFDQDPGTMMTLWPTDGFIKKQIKQRVDPFIASARPLADLFGGKRSRATESTLFQKSSPVAEWIFASARSAANLRGTPAVRGMADEVDEAPEDVGDQGDVIMLLLGRLSAAGPRKKLFIPCTPTIESSSIVWRWFLKSDQAWWTVPCPHCGTFQRLEWERFTWPKGSPHRVEYRCIACDRGVRETAKRAMNHDGRFEPTAAASYAGCVGRHVSGLYASAGQLSWREIANEHEAAGGSEKDLKTFWNIRLGLPWAQTSDAPEASALESNREPMVAGALPARCGAITAGADVQADRVEVRVWGWGPGLESWLLAKEVIPRRKARSAGGDAIVFDERTVEDVAAEIASRVLARRWVRADGAFLRVHLGLMDVNFDTTWAWRVVQVLGARWGAVRGSGGADEGQGGQRMARLVAASTVERDGIKNLTLWRVSSPMAFSEFYRLLRLARPEGEDGSWHGYVHLPDWVDDGELAQLTADREQYDPRKRRRVWIKTGPNEAGDCRKYARAALEAAGIAAWTSDQWQQRAATLERLAMDVERQALVARSQPGAARPRPAANFLGGTPDD